MIKRSFVIVFVLILLVSIFGQYAGSIPTATAQSSLDPWTTPVNVSRSGSTSEPSMVLDSNGYLHVFWYDQKDEQFFYTRMEGNQWSTPVQLNVPFENEDPRFLLYDPQGIIHAFWTNDDDDLLYAYISVDSLIEKPAWSRTQLLSAGVMDFDAKIDSTGKVHVAYLRVEETSNLPAGIYHRSAEKAGAAWSNSILLDESRYFRSVDDKTANVKIAITQANGSDYIFIAWDNRSLRQVYLIKSTDGGNQWQDAQVIDGPSESLHIEDPFNLLVHAYGSNVLLIWEAGFQSGFDCTQYSQFSTDLGETWLKRQTMLKNTVGCPQDNRLFDLDDGLVLMSTIQDEVYLLAWNGQEWSEPQPQSGLATFTNPDTFNTILFRCYQPALGGKQLYVAGCDIEGNGDIWVTSRTLDPLYDWFAQPLGWIKPVTLTEEQQNISSPVIICAPEEQKHVFWLQMPKEGKSNSDSAIFYTKQDENGWIQPGLILDKPDTRAIQPVVKSDGRGNLVAAWGSSNDSGIYSSIVSIDKAQNAFNWSEPVQLPSLQRIASAPDVQIDQAGNIIVVYAIGVNEDRGIYLTRSGDGGKTWIPPIRVFDAVTSKWAMVGEPKLAISSDGMLHLIWTQNPLAGGVLESALYYARSGDGGETWSQPQLVIEDSFGSIDILSTGERTIQMFWLSLGKVSGIFHQFSTNGGESWSAPGNISGAGNVPKAMSVTADQEGRLHLLQAIEEQAGSFAINYLDWNGARWSTQDRLSLGDEYPGHIYAMDMCLDSKEQLAAVFALVQEDNSSGNLEQSLYFTSRSIDKEAMEAPALTQLVLPTEVAAQATDVPNSEAVATATIASTQTAITPSPTAIIASGNQVDSNASGMSGNPWNGLVLGLGLAILIIILAFSLIIRNRRRHVY